MGRFVNSENGIVVNVADDKDDRFASPLWAAEDAPAESKASAKRTASKSSDK